jgi:hypothetical protein
MPDQMWSNQTKFGRVDDDRIDWKIISKYKAGPELFGKVALTAGPLWTADSNTGSSILKTSKAKGGCWGTCIGNIQNTGTVGERENTMTSMTYRFIQILDFLAGATAARTFKQPWNESKNQFAQFFVTHVSQVHMFRPMLICEHNKNPQNNQGYSTRIKSTMNKH